MLVERLVPQMRSWAHNGNVVNIHEENKAYSMDCTNAYFFGLDNGTNFIEDPKEKELLKSFELGMSRLFWLVEAPKMATWLSCLGMQLVSDTQRRQ